jgi:hypothetical protein
MTAMIDQFANSPVVGIVSSHSSSSNFAAVATTHHSPMMLPPGQPWLRILIFGSDFWDPNWKRNSNSAFDS